MVNTNTQLLKFNSFLILILPISFVIGPLIVEIISVILIFQLLYFSFKQNKFFYLKNKIILFFILFYIFLLITLFFSKYFSEIYINVTFYFRFILFATAIYFFLNFNSNLLKKIYLVLSLTILVVVFDGYWQFFTNQNLIGFEKYRVDRISGLFKDDLILGSYLSRLIPLHLGLILFFKNYKKITLLNIFLIFFTIIIIFLSGERAAFFKVVIFLSIMFIILNIQFKIKLSLIALVIFSVITLSIFHPILVDRYYKQTIRHIVNPEGKFLVNYLPMFNTSIKMLNSSKLIGHGPKSYRYLCDKKEYVTYYPTESVIDNTLVKLTASWKELRKYEILDFFVNEGEIINKGDKLFSYRFLNDNKISNFLSDKEGRINKIERKALYVKDAKIMDISPIYSPKKEFLKKNACNTHPHNFYFQLLAETGLIGFLFLIILFLYLGYVLLKNYIFNFSKVENKLTNLELSLISGFFVILWPLSTNGNFFNNWINLMTFYPLGILLHVQNLKKS